MAVHVDQSVRIPPIREFYHTLAKMNEGCYKAKVDWQDFNLKLGDSTTLESFG